MSTFAFTPTPTPAPAFYIIPDPYEGKTRQQYLAGLVEEYGEEYGKIIHELAVMLGPDEDFDGLITELEDYIDLYEDEEYDE